MCGISAVTPARVRQILSEDHPACFKPKGALKLPLKIGIHNDIALRHPELNMAEIKAGLKDYTDGPKYLEQCTAGAWRVDLDGNKVAMVKWWEYSHSLHRLDRLREQWRNPQTTLGDIVNDALNQAKDTSIMNEISHNAYVHGATVVVPGEPSARSFLDALASHINVGQRGTAVTLLEQREKRMMDFAVHHDADAVRRRAALHLSMQRVVQNIKDGKKIEAIKLYRELTGVGLKESKDFVESIQPGVQAISPTYQQDGFIVATRHGEDLMLRSEHDHVESAQAAAARTAEHYNTETLLMRVLGKTKRTFAMLP